MFVAEHRCDVCVCVCRWGLVEPPQVREILSRAWCVLACPATRAPPLVGPGHPLSLGVDGASLGPGFTPRPAFRSGTELHPPSLPWDRKIWAGPCRSAQGRCWRAQPGPGGR